MRKVLLLGAGHTVSRGFKNSLDPEKWQVTEFSDDLASNEEVLLSVGVYRPDFVYAGTEDAVEQLSRIRNKVRDYGAAVFLPRKEVVSTCLDKWETYRKLSRVGVPVPFTTLAKDMSEIEPDFIHVRPRRGGGGTNSFSGLKPHARMWVDHHHGRHTFTAAEHLQGPTVTWQGIYNEGLLVVSQQRKRLAWTNGDRGSALVSETYSDAIHDKIAKDAVRAVDYFPNGIFGVDMTLDRDGNPRVTEINIGRFFTTIEFFTRAGVNFPDIACRLALKEWVDPLHSNPLPNGLRWKRGMDVEPVLEGGPSLSDKTMIRDWWGALPYMGECPY